MQKDADRSELFPLLSKPTDASPLWKGTGALLQCCTRVTTPCSDSRLQSRSTSCLHKVLSYNKQVQN